MRRSTQRLFSPRLALVSLSILGAAAAAACGNTSSAIIVPPGETSPPGVFGDGGIGDPSNVDGGVFIGAPPNAATAAPDFGTTVSAATPPPALGASSLALSRDGLTAIATDSDRDRLLLVDLASKSVRQTVALPAGSLPGRFAEDQAGNVHVVLRNTGSVATISLTTGAIVATRAACAEPRGIAYRASNDAVVVACMTGTVVALPAAPTNSSPLYRSKIGGSLRDVVVQNDVVYVSTFRDATLLTLSDEGTVASTSAAQISGAGRRFQPQVAWRTIPTTGGAVLMIHQGATMDAVDVTTPGAYGGGGCTPPIVASFASSFASNVAMPGPTIPHGVLPIDGAVTANGTQLAVIAAGNDHTPNGWNFIWVPNVNVPVELGVPSDFHAPFLPTPADFDGGPGTAEDASVEFDASGVAIPSPPPNDEAGVGSVSGGCGGSSAVGYHLDGQPVAITLDSNDLPLILTREPALLLRQDALGKWTTIALGGASVEDTGHAVFHSNSGGDLACASCHAEALDDGHTWNFNASSLGPSPRRTQTFRGGFLSTAPFHWDGSQNDMPALVNTVFVGRMSGPPLLDDQTTALATWMNALPTLQHDAPDATTAAAIGRGKATFEDPNVGCSTCHSGAMFTNNMTLDVGTGGAFQVPSLLGVSFRAPYLHSGLAPTLAARFDPTIGGGDQHGKTSTLTPAQISDLIAYLGSL